MFCGKCGKEIQGNSQFCPECGTKVDTNGKHSINLSSYGVGDALAKNRSFIANIVLIVSLIVGLLLEGGGIFRVTTVLSGYFGDLGTMEYGLLDLFEQSILNTIMVLLYIAAIAAAIIPLFKKKPLHRILNNITVLAPTLAILTLILIVVIESQDGGSSYYKFAVTAKGWFLVLFSLSAIISGAIMKAEAKKARKALKNAAKFDQQNTTD